MRQPSLTSAGVPVTIVEMGRFPIIPFVRPTVFLACAMSIYSKYHIIEARGISLMVSSRGM